MTTRWTVPITLALLLCGTIRADDDPFPGPTEAADPFPSATLDEEPGLSIPDFDDPSPVTLVEESPRRTPEPNSPFQPDSVELPPEPATFEPFDDPGVTPVADPLPSEPVPPLPAAKNDGSGEPVKLRVEMLEKSSRSVSLPRKVSHVHHVNDVVRINPFDGDSIQLTANRAGIETVYVDLVDGLRAEIEVRVTADTRELDDLVKRLYPNAEVEMHVVRNALLLRGKVERAEHVQQIVEIAEQFYPTVLDQLAVAQPTGPKANDPFGYPNPANRIEPGTEEFSRAIEELNRLLERRKWDEARSLAGQLSSIRNPFNVDAYIEWMNANDPYQSASSSPRTIPKGMRVVTIRVASTAVTGLLSRGDAVDVLFLPSKPAAEGQLSPRSRTLVRLVEVFATEPVRADPGSGEDVMVSLLVSPRIANLIALADRHGDLGVVIRKGEKPLGGEVGEAVSFPSDMNDPNDVFGVQSKPDKHGPSVADEIRALRDEVRSLRKDVGRILDRLDERKEPEKATVSQRLEAAHFGLGLEIAGPADMPKGTQYRGGFKVLDVEPSGHADRAGLRAGDILVGIGIWEVRSLENFEYAMEALTERGDDVVKVHVLRVHPRSGVWDTMVGTLELPRDPDSGKTDSEGEKAADADAGRSGDEASREPLPIANPLSPQPVRLGVGIERRFELDEDELVTAAITRDETVATVTIDASNAVRIRGVKPGQTTIEVWTGRENKQRHVAEVFVGPVVIETVPRGESLFRKVPGISVDDSPMLVR